MGVSHDPALDSQPDCTDAPVPDRRLVVGAAMSLRVLDLFSGIGGMSLGLERAGMRTVAFCEITPFCRAVLRKHWPDVPIYEDVRTLSYDGAVDVVCGGYPCQPFSVAGQRRGAADDRHLWPAMLAVIKRHRPAWVLGENVAGHISVGLDAVLSDLESAGYAARSFVIPAVAVDARHRRDRVWIVANAASAGLQIGELSIFPQNSQEAGCGLVSESERCRSVMADSCCTRFEKRDTATVTDPAQHSPGSTAAAWRPWEPEPGVGRVAHGIPRRMDRLKALGNAVVPRVVEMIGRAILQAHGGRA